MDKNPLVLEKENTEIKSHGSTDQVRQPSQTTEIGSSYPKKVKRVRRIKKCKEVASLEAKKKLKITFYINRTVGTNSNLFSRHLGKIICDCKTCVHWEYHCGVISSNKKWIIRGQLLQ